MIINDTVGLIWYRYTVV